MISQRIQSPLNSTGSIPQSDPLSAENQQSNLSSEQQKVDELLAENSNLNANAVTDEIFFGRYPELRGTSLTKDSPLASEWKQIKSEVVQPRMSSAGKTTQTPATTSNAEQPASSTSVAAEARNMLDLKAGLLQKSLQGIFGPRQPTIEPGFEAPVSNMSSTPSNPGNAEIKLPGRIEYPNITLQKSEAPVQTADPKPAGPSASRAQELAKTDISNMTESQKYDHLKDLIEAGGGTFNAAPDARNIVSIRDQDSVDAGVKNDKGEGQGVYNDRMYVLWKDDDGTSHVKEFTGNTEPNRRWSNDKHGSQDVNSDGNNDAGRLLPGFYEFKVDKRNGTEDALRPTSDVKVERDLDGDGLYNDDFTGSAGTSILFHDGKGNNSTGSAGCQTLKKSEWPFFWEAVSQGSNKENIGYTLVQLDENNAAANG
jgi:hypothetical protein